MFIHPKEESSWNRGGPFWHTWGHHVCGLPFAICWERQSSCERKSQTGWNLLFCYLILFSLEEKKMERKRRKRAAEGGRQSFFHTKPHLVIVLLIKIKRSVKAEEEQHWVWTIWKDEAASITAGLSLTSLHCWHSFKKNSWTTVNASLL